MTDPIPSERFASALPAIGSELRVYRDRLEYDPGGLRGLVSGSKTVDAEAIDLVLRRDGRLDRVLGAGSYDLIRSGAPTVRLYHLADTDAVERALDQYVPAPRDRVDAVDDEAVLTRLQHDRVAWRQWPSDEPVPRSPVVTDDALLAKLDGDGAASDGEREPRRSTPGPDRGSFGNAASRDGNSGNSGDFTGGTLGTTAGFLEDESGK